MTTVTNYGDAEPTAQEQRIAELERQLAQEQEEWRQLARDTQYAIEEAATLRAAVDTYAADLARVSAERDSLRSAATAALAGDRSTKAAIDAALRSLQYSAPENKAAILYYKIVEPLQAKIGELERQNAEAKANAEPRDEIANLYDAYAYATAGWEPGKAEHFPAVLRYLVDTSGAEGQP